jgi:hypothetical protein
MAQRIQVFRTGDLDGTNLPVGKGDTGLKETAPAERPTATT